MFRQLPQGQGSPIILSPAVSPGGQKGRAPRSLGAAPGALSGLTRHLRRSRGCGAVGSCCPGRGPWAQIEFYKKHTCEEERASGGGKGVVLSSRRGVCRETRLGASGKGPRLCALRSAPVDQLSHEQGGRLGRPWPGWKADEQEGTARRQVAAGFCLQPGLLCL